MMIKYIEDLFYSIEYHFLSTPWSHKKIKADDAVDKAVKYCRQHHIKYSVGEIQNTDMETYYVVFSYVKPEDGEIQNHVVWCEYDENDR